MVNLWFFSDTHFDHGNTITVFKRHDGSPLRDFDTPEEMNEHIVERANSVIKPGDHVYHLGDVAIRPSGLAWMKCINGHHRLIRGNHDIFKTKKYLEFFDEIYGCRVFDNILFTHIPVHTQSLGRFKMNVHGHLHHQPEQLGPGYHNISVEMLDDYTPVSLEELKSLY
jgi:calcineurin-like phosphoesterase family protein